ncbi:MAG: hypothetical protein NVSMB19_08050 [Vulcanimicrobiaceae bacterium]
MKVPSAAVIAATADPAPCATIDAPPTGTFVVASTTVPLSVAVAAGTGEAGALCAAFSLVGTAIGAALRGPPIVASATNEKTAV